jgi:hypothetical protein
MKYGRVRCDDCVALIMEMEGNPSWKTIIWKTENEMNLREVGSVSGIQRIVTSGGTEASGSNTRNFLFFFFFFFFLRNELYCN